MKIKRLEIVGFKSFADKVSLDFQQGITSIVGPNGCGKSNVVDAIRWVMGEQSAKNLRGRNMEDIIFGGSEFRKPLGLAEVSMVFSTGDGKVPAKYLNYSEIQVTRRLYRDGESEYLLNKTPCRLMDITELFMDTGVGARAYSIIEQGKIGMILHSKPEERRFLIEEAAGVTKFKARKQVALKKIDLTRQNLLRIGDILSEIRRQLNALQRQAKKAEKFREYREELKEIEILATVKQFMVLDHEKEGFEDGLRQSVSKASSLAADLEKMDLLLEEKRVALVEQEKEVASAQEGIYRNKGDVQGCENRLEFQKKELAGLERQKERLEGDLAGLEKQLADACNELAELESRSGEYTVEAAGEYESLQAREMELEEMAGAEREFSMRLEEARRELFSLHAELAQLNNQKATAVRRLEGLAERVERNHRENALLNEKLIEASGRVAELERGLNGACARKNEFMERLPVLSRHSDELTDELGKLEHSLQAKRDELSRASSRLHSLQELEAQFAGYGQGVRQLFLSERFKGRLIGVAADFMEAGEDLEAALESVMAERLQYVLCAGEADALDAIGYLKETVGGRCSFVVGGLVAQSVGKPPESAIPLLSRISIAEEYRELLEPLLADAFLVDGLPAAVSLSQLHPRMTFVTPEGDLASDGGVINGGSVEAAGQGLVHKKREIRELGGEVTRLSALVLEMENRRDGLKGDKACLENELGEVRQDLHHADIQLVNMEKDLLRAREELQRIVERIEIGGVENDQLREEGEALESEIADAEARKGGREEKRQGLEAEVANFQESLLIRKREIDVAREAVTALKVRSAQLREKKESAGRAMKRTEELVQDLRGRIERHRQELDRGCGDRERLAFSIAAGEEELKSLMVRHLHAEQAFVSLRQRYETDAEVVRSEESRLKGVRGEWEEAREEVSSHNLAISELVMKLNHLASFLADKYRADIVSLIPAYGELAFDPEETGARQLELTRLIDEMGEVNLMAIEEYRELEERFNFLSAQKTDLEESLQSLQQAIQRINRTTRKRFLETFNLVNEKFQEVFPRLFCGGRAELKLTNEEDLLETGIDIIVQPPGKKLQNVTLLSGGEKALTAVALIFSIFLIKPSPFCLLDEVDAPLDDANIGRFNDMVREMSIISQFIIITHNKATMAVADTLYGVTMEVPGASKVVSVKLN